jgi:hypothetical protein
VSHVFVSSGVIILLISPDTVADCVPEAIKDVAL